MKQNGVTINFDKAIKAFEEAKKQDVQNAVQEIIKRMHNELSEEAAKRGEKLVRGITPIIRDFYDAGAKKFCSLLLDQLQSMKGETDIHAS